MRLELERTFQDYNIQSGSTTHHNHPQRGGLGPEQAEFYDRDGDHVLFKAEYKRVHHTGTPAPNVGCGRLVYHLNKLVYNLVD